MSACIAVCLSSQPGRSSNDPTYWLYSWHVSVSKPTLYGWCPAGQTPSRAVPPCMPPVALDELHLFLFAFLVPPAIRRTSDDWN